MYWRSSYHSHLAVWSTVDRTDTIAAAKASRPKSPPTAPQRFSAELASPALATFARVFERVKRDYVRTVKVTDLPAARKGSGRIPAAKRRRGRQARDAAIDGMLQSLDIQHLPHPPELKAMRDRTEVSSVASASRSANTILLGDAVDATPAFRAGIKSGDIITRADDRELAKLSLGAAVRLLRGPAGAPIALTIERKDSAPILVRLVREIIRIEGVRWRVERDVGYIRISEFTRRVGERVESAVDKIRYKTGSKLRGFVLDLRNNPGGPFDEAVIVSDAFLEGSYCLHQSRHHENTTAKPEISRTGSRSSS